MPSNHWDQEFPASITVCDADGIILEMNNKALETFATEGGIRLLGTNLLECHPEPARSRVAELLKKQQSNVYTIQKNGIRKLIYQSPWFDNGRFAGIVELSLPLPDVIPHFNRDVANE